MRVSNCIILYRSFSLSRQKKKQIGNRPEEEATKMRYYERLIYKQFFKVSGLNCGLQFLSYLPICRNISCTFVELCMEMPYWCTVLVHQYGRQKSTKHLEFTFSIKALSFHSRTSILAENQEERLFFNNIAFLFWHHALRKLGSSICCIFEMKHAMRMETCTKIYFLLSST